MSNDKNLDGNQPKNPNDANQATMDELNEEMDEIGIERTDKDTPPSKPPDESGDDGKKDDDENNDEGDGEPDTPSDDDNENEEGDGKKDDKDEGDEGSDDDDSGDDDSGGEAPQRPNKYIPIDKYKDDKDKWAKKEKELLDKIQTLEQGTGSNKDSIEEEIRVLSEESGFEPEAIQKIIDIASKKSELSKETLDTLAQLQTEKKEAAEKAHFDKEWDEVATNLRETYPDATGKQVSLAKKRMDEISHTEKYSRYRLEDILALKKKEFETILKHPKAKSGEQSAGGRGVPAKPEKGAGEPISDHEMTPEKLAQEEDKLNEGMGDLRITRQGKQVHFNS